MIPTDPQAADSDPHDPIPAPDEPAREGDRREIEEVTISRARPLDGRNLPTGQETAIHAAQLADAKQGLDIRILDVTGLTSIADYFVVCSGTSMPHLKAVRNEIVTGMRERHDLRSLAADGDLESHWLVVDYGDVMVHMFLAEEREFYALEDLWSDARPVDWQSSGG